MHNPPCTNAFQRRNSCIQCSNKRNRAGDFPPCPRGTAMPANRVLVSEAWGLVALASEFLKGKHLLPCIKVSWNLSFYNKKYTYLVFLFMQMQNRAVWVAGISGDSTALCIRCSPRSFMLWAELHPSESCIFWRYLFTCQSFVLLYIVTSCRTSMHLCASNCVCSDQNHKDVTVLWSIPGGW